MQTLMDESKIKQLFKEALLEALKEQKGLFQALIVEAIEDIALTKAIEEGQGTETVSRQEIDKILEGQE